jgi:predicted NBD/HSP70 family sugar kinase
MTDEQPNPRVLAVDIGGSHVKMLLSTGGERRRFPSGPDLTAAEMVEQVLELTKGWEYDVISVGVPAPVLAGKVAHDPVNLGTGWAGFDFERAFGKPTRVVNDAAMQALGSYDGGRMLFLGLGTGLGSAMIVDGLLEPMELGHMPYKKATYEDYVGARGLARMGKRRWRAEVAEVIEAFRAALEPEYIVLGGGNAEVLKELPPGTRLGDNRNAFLGGFRLWQNEGVLNRPRSA